MAVTTTHSIREYTSTGVETVFTVDFQFLAPEHLVVTKGATGVETTLVLGTDYTVAGPSAPLPGTGSITLAAPATAGHKVRITRSTPRDQLTTLSPAGPISTAAVMATDDKLTLIVQEIADGAAIAGTFLHGNLGGGSLHAQATTSVDGFYPAADKLANDNHRANTSNPHATTAAQVGAAPVGHVGSAVADTATGHPLATANSHGFYPKEHFAKVDALPPSVDPLNVVVFDHFAGGTLDTNRWTRTTSGTAPTGSFPAGLEFGVYRETTAAAATSQVLKRSGVRVKTSRSPTWYGAYGFGAAGPSYANISALAGMAEDPSTLTQNYAFFRVNPTGTVQAVSRGTGTEQTSDLGALVDLFGVAPADTAIHAFKIEIAPTSVKFYIGGSLVATHTLQVPESTALLETFDRLANTGGSVAQSMDQDYAYAVAAVSYA